MTRISSSFAQAALCLIFAVFITCTKSPNIAGTSEVGNPQKVSAVIVDSKTGAIAPGVPILLINADYNPVKDTVRLSKRLQTTLEPNGFTDTSDQFGRIEIKVPQTGNYNLISMSEAYKYRLFIESIAVKKNDSLDLGTIGLHNPGKVLVNIDSAVFSTGGSLILLGTGIAQAVTAPGVVALEAPAGALNVRYVNSVGNAVPGWLIKDGVTVADSAITDITGFAETITTPALGKLDSLITTGMLDTAQCGGSKSNKYSAVQYRIDWGDGSWSAWSAEGTFAHSWTASGTFSVRGIARSILDTTILSSWSVGRLVAVFDAHSITTPVQPAAVAVAVLPGSSDTFTSGGSVSNLGHPLAYRFDWGDGAFSPWSTTAIAMHSFSLPGDYVIRSMAHSIIDTAVISAWSSGVSVQVVDTTDKRPRIIYQQQTMNCIIGMATSNSCLIIGKATQFMVSPSLPTGLIMNSVSGTISGTPTTASLMSSYAITAITPDETEISRDTVTITIVATPIVTAPSAPTILPDDSQPSINRSYTHNFTLSAIGRIFTFH